MAHAGKNKARNQTIGAIDAPWFKAKLRKRRKKNKIAGAARRKNRRK